MSERVLRSRRVFHHGSVQPTTIRIRDGVIASIGPHDENTADLPVTDVGELLVFPGVVDTHVHVNEPGRTAWEGFETATKAAAAGGVTTLVDMPLNSSPTTTSRAALATKIASLDGKLWIDVGLWGGVVPGNSGELKGMLEDGILGFKCFLIDSGIDEFLPAKPKDLDASMPILAEAKAPLLVHAELAGPVDAALRALSARGTNPQSYADFLASRPRAAEDEAVALMISKCREHRSPVHIVHHSSSDSLQALADARQEGLELTVETCPHYLHFAAEEIPDGATQYKCVPPIREAENRDQLWGALQKGVIDQVVSDHSPCTVDLKQLDVGDFDQAWGGISSLQLGLNVVWTDTAARGGTLSDVARWMCEAPAALAGLADRKGRIAPGYDADFAIWDPDESVTVHAANLFHRNHLTPYEGQTLRGRVHQTIVRGHTVYERGTCSTKPMGKWQKR